MSLKKIFYLFLIISVAGISTSCESVIDIDLNEADPKLVVEAYFTNETGSAKVILTRTVSYFEAQAVPQVDGAVVSISDEFGNTFSLAETSPGVYKNAIETGIPGRNYTLNIDTGEETVSATSYMPPLVKLDSLEPESNSSPMFGNFTLLRCHFDDPGETEDYYRPILALNGTTKTDISVFDDGPFNGVSAAIPIFLEESQSGDTAKVSLWHIDETNYRFFHVIGDNFGPGNNSSAAPGNPDNNLSGDVAGIFTCASLDVASVILP